MRRALPHADGFANEIIVPRTLKVSEANTFKPRADIVWHGDPAGDRYQQVGDIMTAAATRATTGMTQGRAVMVEIALTKFHGVTEKTRYTIGGMHEMRFDLTVNEFTRDLVLGRELELHADSVQRRALDGDRECERWHLALHGHRDVQPRDRHL